MVFAFASWPRRTPVVRRGVRVLLSTALAATLLAVVTPAIAQEVPPPVPIAITDTVAAPVETTLRSVGSLPFTVAARVAGDRTARVDALAAARVPLWLVVDVPARADDVDGWRQRLQQVLAAHAADIVVVEIDVA